MKFNHNLGYVHAAIKKEFYPGFDFVKLDIDASLRCNALKALLPNMNAALKEKYLAIMQEKNNGKTEKKVKKSVIELLKSGQ